MKTISRDQLKTQLEHGHNFYLIDVLDEESFNDYHLPKAVNIPVKSDNFEERIKDKVPKKDDEIVVYCKDKSCNASPEAAKKIEAMGYKNVYDYEEGKVDWKNANLPVQ